MMKMDGLDQILDEELYKTCCSIQYIVACVASIQNEGGSQEQSERLLAACNERLIQIANKALPLAKARLKMSVGCERINDVVERIQNEANNENLSWQTDVLQLATQSDEVENNDDILETAHGDSISEESMNRGTEVVSFYGDGGENYSDSDSCDSESRENNDDDGESQEVSLLTQDDDGESQVSLLTQEGGMSMSDHLTRSKNINNDFLAIIRSKSTTETRCIECEPCDWCSVLIYTVQQIFLGRSSLEDLEKIAQMVGPLLEAEMSVIESAKKIALANLDDGYAFTTSGAPLATTLRTFAGEKSNTAGLGTHFKQPHKNTLTNFSFSVAVKRTMSQITVVDFGGRLSKKMDKELWESYMAFCGSVYGRPVEAIRLDQLFGMVFIPVINDDSRSFEDKSKVFHLAELLFSNLPRKDVAVKEFEKSEVVPLDRGFETCSEEELEAYKFNHQAALYLCEKGKNGDVTKQSGTRRHVACRLFWQSLHCRSVSQMLLRGGHVEAADIMFFGLLCTPAMTFDKNRGGETGSGLLLDERMYQPNQVGYVDSILKRTIKYIKKRVVTAIKAFHNDKLHVNLTNDLENGTAVTLESLRKYFGLLDIGELAADSDESDDQHLQQI